MSSRGGRFRSGSGSDGFTSVIGAVEVSRAFHVFTSPPCADPRLAIVAERAVGVQDGVLERAGVGLVRAALFGVEVFWLCLVLTYPGRSSPLSRRTPAAVAALVAFLLDLAQLLDHAIGYALGGTCACALDGAAQGSFAYEVTRLVLVRRGRCGVIAGRRLGAGVVAGRAPRLLCGFWANYCLCKQPVSGALASRVLHV